MGFASYENEASLFLPYIHSQLPENVNRLFYRQLGEFEFLIDDFT